MQKKAHTLRGCDEGAPHRGLKFSKVSYQQFREMGRGSTPCSPYIWNIENIRFGNSNVHRFSEFFETDFSSIHKRGSRLPVIFPEWASRLLRPVRLIDGCGGDGVRSGALAGESVSMHGIQASRRDFRGHRRG